MLTTCIWCGTGCNFYLRVQDGRIVGVLPSAAHPVSRGRLCLKGWKAYEFASHPDRLQVPLLRQGDGFMEIPWNEALDMAAERLLDIKKKYGPGAIAVFGSGKCTNEDNYLLQRFARACLGTDSVDHCARLCHASTVAGLARAFGSGAMTNSIPEILETDLMLITGSNTAEQHPVIASWMMRAITRGARLLVVDPRKTPMARIAHRYLAPRPGTDIAWINGFINVIVNRHLADEAFIREHTEGFEEMWAVAKEYTPERVEKITGIPTRELERAAVEFGEAKGAMIFYAMGITQHITGTGNVMALANLAMVTGNMGKPGTGVNPLRGQNNVQGACDVGVLPGLLPGYQKISDPEAVKRVEELWRARVPREKGLATTQVPDAILEGKVKALYSMGENPVLSHPDIPHARRAFSSLEFMVVQDIFLTETARLAHLVLPAASWAEKDGTFTSTDRRVQRVRKATEPPGDARDDWWIVQEVAKRMGHDMGFSGPEEIFRELAQISPIYHGITYERMETESLAWPCPHEGHPGTPYLHKDGNFARGKGKFNPTEHADPPELPDEEYPFYLSTGRVGVHWHTRSMTRRIGILEREYPQALVDMNPEDAERLGIKNGQRVRVVSRRGAIESAVRITDSVPPGLVFATFHHAEASANMLTINAVDPIALIPELKIAAVRIEKI